MKIKIENDCFEITKRIKEIDDGYFIVFDTEKAVYQLHNYNQKNTYCLTIPYDDLDSRVLDLILYSNIVNIDNILEDIDNNNKEVENKSINNIKDYSDYILREIHNFASNSSKEMDLNSYGSFWR